MSRPLTYRWICPGCGDIFDTEADQSRCLVAHAAAERLHAAASDLYKAAKHAENALMDYVSMLERSGSTLNYGNGVLSMLRAAIAKADGK
jgi:hypothetical protein